MHAEQQTQYIRNLRYEKGIQRTNSWASRYVDYPKIQTLGGMYTGKWVNKPRFVLSNRFISCFLILHTIRLPMSECTIDNAFLCKHSMFGGLSDEELLVIHDFLDEQFYAKGTRILEQGESNNTVYFIVSGEVSIQKHPLGKKGQERVITTLHAGDSFGEMELIDIQSCAASVICLTDTLIISLSNQNLYKLSTTHLKTYTMLILNLARDISRRLRSTDNLLALISKKSP